MTDQINDEQDDDAEFEAHFNEFAAGKAAPVEESADNEGGDESNNEQDEDAGEGEQEQGDKTPEAEDPLAKANKEIDDLKHKYNSDIGRVNAYQRQIDEQKALIESLKKAPKENPEASGLTDEEWDSLKADYPDLAKGFESKLNNIISANERQMQEINSKIQPLEQQQQTQYRSMQMQELSSAHPDWQDVVKSPDYNSWLNSQPDEVQAFMQSTEATKNIYLLNAFKATTKPAPMQTNDLQQRRQKQLKQAQTVANRATNSSKGTLSDDDFDASFEHYANKKDSRI